MPGDKRVAPDTLSTTTANTSKKGEPFLESHLIVIPIVKKLDVLVNSITRFAKHTKNWLNRAQLVVLYP